MISPILPIIATIITIILLFIAPPIGSLFLLVCVLIWALWILEMVVAGLVSSAPGIILIVSIAILVFYLLYRRYKK